MTNGNLEAGKVVNAGLTLYFNGLCNAATAGVYRSAAKGRMIGWDAIRSFKVLTQVGEHIQYGDPMAALQGMMPQANGLLAEQPVQQAVDDTPPVWAQKLIADVAELKAK